MGERERGGRRTAQAGHWTSPGQAGTGQAKVRVAWVVALFEFAVWRSASMVLASNTAVTFRYYNCNFGGGR